MIELTKDTLQLEKQYSPHLRTIVLFGELKLSFWKQGRGDYLYWEHGGKHLGSETGLRITHSGKMTWHSIKKTLEQYLNYHESHLRKVIIKSTFK